MPTFALSLGAGLLDGHDSGLDSNGVQINLFNVGGVIYGSTTANIADAVANQVFTIAVSGSGVVTLLQFAEIDHPIADDPTPTVTPFADQLATLANGLVNLTASATITDGRRRHRHRQRDHRPWRQHPLRRRRSRRAAHAVASRVLDDEAQPYGITVNDASGDVDAPDEAVKVVTGVLNIAPGADGLASDCLRRGGFADSRRRERHRCRRCRRSTSIRSPRSQPSRPSRTAWTPSGAGGTLTGTSASYPTGTPVFTLVVDGAGNYTFTLNAPLAHPLTDDPALVGAQIEYEDNLTLAFTYTATDGDGDTDTAVLNITVDDDTPDLGGISSVTANNSSATYTGTFAFDSGADGIGGVDFTTLPAGLKSGGADIQYTESGNVLIAHTGNVLDPVFTLTLNAASGNYVFQQFKPLDGTVTTVGVSGSTAHGTGPQELVVLNAAGTDVAILSGWQASSGFAGTFTQDSVKGSTSGWGVGSGQNFNGQGLHPVRLPGCRRFRRRRWIHAAGLHRPRGHDRDLRVHQLRRRLARHPVQGLLHRRHQFRQPDHQGVVRLGS